MTKRLAPVFPDKRITPPLMPRGATRADRSHDVLIPPHENHAGINARIAVSLRIAAGSALLSRNRAGSSRSSPASRAPRRAMESNRFGAKNRFDIEAYEFRFSCSAASPSSTARHGAFDRRACSSRAIPLTSRRCSSFSARMLLMSLESLAPDRASAGLPYENVIWSDLSFFRRAASWVLPHETIR